MQATKLSVEEFVQWAALPENEDRLFELIDGEIVEVSPGRTRKSELAQRITGATFLFCTEHNLPWHTSGGDGAYNILGNVIAPDFAYKPGAMSDDYPDPVPPLWAVEIISPTDKAGDIRSKRNIYLAAGIVLWEVYEAKQSVDIYVPGQPVRTVTSDGTLDAGDALPGFTMPVAQLFE